MGLPGPAATFLKSKRKELPPAQRFLRGGLHLPFPTQEFPRPDFLWLCLDSQSPDSHVFFPKASIPCHTGLAPPLMLGQGPEVVREEAWAFLSLLPPFSGEGRAAGLLDGPLLLP